jgi:hypothetical protein
MYGRHFFGGINGKFPILYGSWASLILSGISIFSTGLETTLLTLSLRELEFESPLEVKEDPFPLPDPPCLPAIVSS